MTARKVWFRAAAGLLAIAALVAACSATTPASPVAPSASAVGAASSASSASPASPAATFTYNIPVEVNAVPTMPSWFDVQMTDVVTGNQFKVSDFTGRVILIDNMATWCPTCQGEMSQVQQIHKQYGADLVTISLDVDPNEDGALLKKYAAKNGFDWIIAVAPTAVGAFLSKNYDVQLLNPPLQPMMIIDKQGGVWGTPFGVKSAESLKKTIDPYLGQ